MPLLYSINKAREWVGEFRVVGSWAGIGICIRLPLRALYLLFTRKRPPTPRRVGFLFQFRPFLLFILTRGIEIINFPKRLRDPRGLLSPCPGSARPESDLFMAKTQ